jgi:HNH endonuclease
MSLYIPRGIRLLVIARANHRCEYCQIPEYISAYEYHVDHIIGIQHGGPSTPSNLAYVCPVCNWKKGPNISTILDLNGPLIPLFNPRTQVWTEHFEVNNGQLTSQTLIGKATIKLLDLNTPSKIEERQELISAGLFIKG